VGKTRQISRRFPPKKRGLRTLLVRSHQQEIVPPAVPPTRPFLGSKSGKIEEKELIQKSKGRRKNMPRRKSTRAAKAVEKRLCLTRKITILQKQKNQKLKDQNQK